MSFTLELLKQNIHSYNDASCLWVAYSGGCDSHVLLHALVAIRSQISPEIKAIHINHGLSPLATEWEEHCRLTCEKLDVPYVAISVNAKARKSSPEEAARHARYAEWKKLIKNNEVLLLAHHQDDQAETLLIQLMRGAGVKGLASMPLQQAFAGGLLCRPLLGFLREELYCYAIDNNLHWIDDPSNFDTDFDRNFLRHDIIPLLETRWPGLKKTLSRTASHQAEANDLLNGLAEQDWLLVQSGQQIKISALVQLNVKRQRNLLRHWIGQVRKLSLPDTVHLQRIINEVLTAAEDAKPEVTWQGGEVRRYQGLLYAQTKQAETDGNTSLQWPKLEQALTLPSNNKQLVSNVSVGEGLSQAKLKNKELSIRFRQGGESCRPVGRGQTHQLKKLFQEWQVPPWLRGHIPLFFVDNELAAVVGYCICEPFAAAEGEAGYAIGLIDSNSSDSGTA